MAEPSPSSAASHETIRRVAESVIVALVSSASLYLLGAVYTDAYYRRLAIEVSSLDLPPSSVALQSVHALWGLVDYPLLLLLGFVLYQVAASPGRRTSQWMRELKARFPRLLPAAANVIVIAPLLRNAASSLRAEAMPHRSVVSEFSSVLGYVGLGLIVYVTWLGWDRRRFLVAELRARRVVPMALVFLAYLLGALVFTADAAELAATDLLTGASPASLRIRFVAEPGLLSEIEGKDLLLVTERNGAYFVVEQEPVPPSPWATSYSIPTASVVAAKVLPVAAGAP